MAVGQVVLLGVAGLGVVLLLLRAVLARGEPWWVAWPLPVGAVGALGVVVTGGSRRLLLTAGAVVLLGLGTQLWWAYRRGRYLEDDVTTLWRRVRGRPAPRRGGRHRVSGDD